MILLFKGLSFQLCTVVYDLCSIAQLAWKLNNILRGFNPLRAVAHFHLVWANCWQQLSDCVTSAGLAHSSSYADKVPSHSLVASLRTAVLFVHQECSAQKIVRCNLTLRTRQGDSQCLGILANFTVNKQTENLIFFFSLILRPSRNEWSWVPHLLLLFATLLKEMSMLYFSGHRGCQESWDEAWPTVRSFLQDSGHSHSNSHPREPAPGSTKLFWAHKLWHIYTYKREETRVKSALQIK